MFPFAHLGIALGSALVLHKGAALAMVDVPWEKRRVEDADSLRGRTARRSQTSSAVTWIDYRLILLGSILPDIIDKPLGIWLLGDGRALAHSLLFSALLVALGLLLYARRRSTGLLSLSFGSIVHLLLDKIWLDPGIFLWPIFGWSFERGDASSWLERWLETLTTEPSVYVPEVIGALLLGALFFYLVRRGTLHSFVRTGTADRGMKRR
ncbi:MAG: metal-dependent hydrolase [Candidatus Binatia bacterium]